MSKEIARRGEGIMAHPVAQAVVGSVKPLGLAKNAGLVAGGVVTSMAGGALARKLVDPVEHFANGGPWREALVDVGASIPLNAAAVGVAYKLKGGDVAFRVGALMAAGSLVGACTEPAKPHVLAAIDKATTFIAGIFGKKKATAAATTAAADPALPPAAPAGGLYDAVGTPGGGLYDAVGTPGGRSSAYALNDSFPGAGI